jgi:hypothetical protein
LPALWADLAGADAVQAHRAVGALIGAPRLAVPFFQQHKPRPVSRQSRERLARLIADLDHDNFNVREKASQELEKQGELAELAFQQALAGKPSPELRLRVNRLLEKLAAAPSKENLRWLRAIQVLEQVGGAEAIQLLKTFAKEAPATFLRQDATAAVARIARGWSRTP